MAHAADMTGPRCGLAEIDGHPGSLNVPNDGAHGEAARAGPPPPRPGARWRPTPHIRHPCRQKRLLALTPSLWALKSYTACQSRSSSGLSWAIQSPTRMPSRLLMLYRSAIAPPTGQRTGRASIASSLCAPRAPVRTCAPPAPSSVAIQLEAQADSPAIASNSPLFSPLSLDTAQPFRQWSGAFPVSSTASRGRPPALSGLLSSSALYAPSPPRAHACVSTPDAPQNAALSEPGAAADAGYAAPSPERRTHGNGGGNAPCGRLAEAGAERHLAVHVRPQSAPTRRAAASMLQTAAGGAGRPSGALLPGRTSAGPGGESTRTVSPRIGPAYTVTPLPMAHTTAGAPCTTRCSPNGIALPGALVTAGRTAVISRTTRWLQHGA